MARLTELAFADAQRLLQAYGLELAELTPLEAGSVNSNFLLSTADGTEYFARLYEEQGPSGADFEFDVNQALAWAGLPAARPLAAKDGAKHVLHAGKPFSLYQRVHGEVLCQRRVTPEIARALGRALAGVHTAPVGNLELSEGRFGFPQIEERLDRVLGSGRTDLLPAASQVRALARRIRDARRNDLPSGLIHGDLFRDNVLVDPATGSIKALLDFESACHGPYVYDLMVTLLAWCYGDSLDVSLARAMIEGYEAVRPLSALERQNLVSEGSVACVRFATTRLTDFSLRVPEGTKPVRDYRRFLERLAALEGGASLD
jgi:homoserine kinase type II